MKTGIAMILLSAFAMAVMTLFVKSAGDLPAVQKSFFRNLVSFFFALGLVLKGKPSFHLSRSILRDLFARAFFGTLGVICYFYSIDRLILADATALNKLSPFFNILFSFLLLKEGITGRQALAVTLAFLGSLFIIKPSFSGLPPQAALAGLLGGLFAGLAYSLVRKLGKSGISSPFVVLTFSAFSCLVLLPSFLLNYRPMTGAQLAFLLAAGLFAGIGQFSLTRAYFHAPAARISAYDYTQILFASLLGFLFFREKPDSYSLLGYGIILSMALWMYRAGRRGDKPPSSL